MHIKSTNDKTRFIILVSLFLFLGCQGISTPQNNDLKEKELALKAKELDLRQRELNLTNLIKSNEDEPLSTIYERVKRGVYLIYTQNELGYSQGSAFVVDKSGLAISNYHVFEAASNVIAINEDGEKYMISEILEINSEKDYIIFRLGNQSNTPFLSISEEIPKVGENVFAVGNPHGLAQTLSTGIISGFRDQGTLLQTTTAITHGSSGGPLFNKKGEVIGITTSGVGEGDLNFALNIGLVPISKYINSEHDASMDVSSLNSSEIKRFVYNYYQLIASEDWNELLNVYSFKLNRYYDKFNIDRYDAIKFAKNYKSIYGIVKSRYDIRWNSLSFSKSDLGTEIMFTMDYFIQKNNNKETSFELNIVMMLDNDNKIISVYENIIDSN